MDQRSHRTFRNRRVKRFIGLVIFLFCLTAFGLYRRHRWPSIGSFKTASGSVSNDLYSSQNALASSNDTDTKSAPESSTGAPNTRSNKPSSFDYPATNQIVEASSPMQKQNVYDGMNLNTGIISDSLHTEEMQSENQPSSFDPTRVALLLDTRPSAKLPAVLLHFISVLPPTWSFRFAGSQAANALVSFSASLRDFVRSGKLSIEELPQYYSIDTQEQISAMLTTSHSIVCAASELSLDDWVDRNYTWLGAPWHMNHFYGGNGGLSLRHIPPIIKVLEKELRMANDLWEDRWLTDRLGLVDESNMPGPEISKFFSVESVWTEKPFGYHLRGSGKYEFLDQNIWGDELRRKMIMDHCPEIKMILDMDLSGPRPEIETPTGAADGIFDQKNQTIDEILTPEIVTLA